MPGIKDVIIGLDTSSSPLVAVVERGGKKYASRRKGVKQERLLFPVLKQLLTKAGADLTHTAKVAIIRGPGRFTGIRISLTFASMLKYLSGAKVYGITVFEAVRLQVAASKRFLTWKAQNPAGSLAVVWHAFREEYFLQIFKIYNRKALSRLRQIIRVHLYFGNITDQQTGQKFITNVRGY